MPTGLPQGQRKRADAPFLEIGTMQQAPCAQTKNKTRFFFMTLNIEEGLKD